jgi:hypothetical protein
MAKVNAQVFVNSNDLGLTNPPIVALYRDNLGMPPDTHGTGMTVLYLTDEAILQPSTPGLGLCLVQNWQDYPSGATPTAAEAARRIEEAFPASEQISAMQQTISWMQQYGADAAKWPQEVKNTKAKLDEKWKYVEEINARMQSYADRMPHDVSNDKNWPSRPAFVKVHTYTPKQQTSPSSVPPSPTSKPPPMSQPQSIRMPMPPMPPKRP